MGAMAAKRRVFAWVDEYVIQDSQLPHFILTKPYDGITADLVNKAIKILNG